MNSRDEEYGFDHAAERVVLTELRVERGVLGLKLKRMLHDYDNVDLY